MTDGLTSTEAFSVKAARTEYGIEEALGRRWSPRAFSAEPVEREKLLRIFEAARWAPSSSNEQPWSFVVATQEDVEGHERSRAFYRDVLEAPVYREYGGTSSVLKFQGSWLLLVTGGEPTEDKPGVTFAPPSDPGSVSHAMTMRVPDCAAAYKTLKSRGAEVRCFFRDPDEHLLDISEAR